MADMRMLQVGDAVRLRYDGAYVTIDKIVCVYPILGEAMPCEKLSPAEHATGRDFARFMEKVFINPDTACWEWYGSRDEYEYARFWFKGRNWHAAQWSFLANGKDLPEGYEVDHICEVRHCVNPDHLEGVTPEENKRRIWIRHYERKARLRAAQHAQEAAK